MFRPSKNPKVEELTKSHRERSINLGNLKPIRIEIPNQKPKRYCCWCTEGQLHHGAQRYCSDSCRESATAWAYPQKEDALKFLLVRQDWKCLICKFDYLPIIQNILARDCYWVLGTSLDTLPWYYLKRLKEHISQERKPEVDHIVPVYKGGNTLGLDNHQAICAQCHKAKSKVDNSGPRKKK